MYKMIFFFLASVISFSQPVYDTLKIFPDTTQFINESLTVTDNICNFAVRFNYSVEESDATIEKIWFCHPRGIGDTNHYFIDYAISVGNLPEDSVIYVSNFIEAIVDYPLWQEVDVPDISFIGYGSFYVSRDIIFRTARSSETIQLINNQFLYDCDNYYWIEGMPCYLAIKVLINRNPSNVHDIEHLDFQLSNNYPNPFNPTTNIDFEIPERTFVKISVYNSIGEKVNDLMNSELDRGEYSLLFNAGELPAGVYILKMETSNQSISKKMMLLK